MPTETTKPRTRRASPKPKDEAPAEEAERPQQTRKRVTEGQVPEIQRLKPTPIKAEERVKLNLWQKRALIIDELGTIPKRGYNAHHQYAYVLEADMVAYLGPLMSKYMLVVDVEVILSTARTTESDIHDNLPNVIERNTTPGLERLDLYTTKSGSTMTLTRLPLRITITNADNPEEKTSIIWVGEGADTGDKGVYKSYTGALKFFYMKWFMVATGDDPEAFERVDELAEGAGTRNVRVEEAKKTQQQPEKGGRQVETTPIQLRSMGAMARALHLGGDEADPGDRARATAAYIDDVLKTSLYEAIPEDLEGEAAERAFKQLVLSIPGDHTGKVLQKMSDDAKAQAAERPAAEEAAPDTQLTEEEAAERAGVTATEVNSSDS